MSSEFLVESKVTKRAVFESTSMIQDGNQNKPKVSYLNLDEKFHSSISKENNQNMGKISEFG